MKLEDYAGLALIGGIGYFLWKGQQGIQDITGGLGQAFQGTGSAISTAAGSAAEVTQDITKVTGSAAGLATSILDKATEGVQQIPTSPAAAAKIAAAEVSAISSGSALPAVNIAQQLAAAVVSGTIRSGSGKVRSSILDKPSAASSSAARAPAVIEIPGKVYAQPISLVSTVTKLSTPTTQAQQAAAIAKSTYQATQTQSILRTDSILSKPASPPVKISIPGFATF